MIELHQLTLEDSAADTIADTIRKMIAAGDLKPGDRINQRTIARQLNVTTTPLREALSKLEQDGTVWRLAGMGVFVRSYSRKEVRDIYLLREVNEGLAARLCAENASDRQIAHLESIVDELDKARESGDLERVKALEIMFHERIAELSGAPIVEAQIKKMMFIRTTIMSLSVPFPQELDPTVETDHGVIVAAIRRRDGSGAEMSMRRQVAEGYRSYLAWLDALENAG